MEHLPATLESQKVSLEKSLLAMDRAMPLEKVVLFGSHARGDAKDHSDIDLCIISDGVTSQLSAAKRLRIALGDVWPRPAFTLIPISPERLKEKKAKGDHFFETILEQGLTIAAKD